MVAVPFAFPTNDVKVLFLLNIYYLWTLDNDHYGQYEWGSD